MPATEKCLYVFATLGDHQSECVIRRAGASVSLGHARALVFSFYMPAVST